MVMAKANMSCRVYKERISVGLADGTLQVHSQIGPSEAREGLKADPENGCGELVRARLGWVGLGLDGRLLLSQIVSYKLAGDG